MPDNNGWRPIEEYDLVEQVNMLVWDGLTVGIGFMYSGKWGDGEFLIYPTHFMPLPEGPE